MKPVPTSFIILCGVILAFFTIGVALMEKGLCL